MFEKDQYTKMIIHKMTIICYNFNITTRVQEHDQGGLDYKHFIHIMLIYFHISITMLQVQVVPLLNIFNKILMMTLK